MSFIRKITLLNALLIGICWLGCGGAPQTPVTTSSSSSSSAVLTSAEVQQIVQKAAESVDAAVTIAVTDRSGNILAIYEKPSAPATTIGDFGATVSTRELALGLARTASFFSNDQAPLSSRTVRYISGIHFPPGIDFAPNAALYGIENTNRGCPLNVTYLPGQSLPPARSADGTSTGLGIITGKADEFDSDPNAVNPGGIPLFKNGSVVGGVGVAGATPTITEFAAFSAVAGAGFAPSPASPGVVIIDGVALPFVNQTTRPAGTNAGLFNGNFVTGPIGSPGPTPSGDLIAVSAGTVGTLTQAEVRGIIDAAVATANQTRAVIRLPDGQRAKFAIAVADLDGRILGLNRMPDATVFSLDVAVGKARNLAYLSSQQANPVDLPGVPLGTAVTNRTISFGAQPLFPAGINGSSPGPFFDLYHFDRAHPCSNGHQPANANQNGIVFFPGSVPLYKGGILVGALGISGDGVEQDDFVSALAAKGFEPPDSIRADQVIIRGVRLPYLKFPRNPTL